MKRGFSILECLIYLSLITVASLLISTMCIRFFESNLKIAQKANIYMSLWMLACHMARDIRLAPIDVRLWVRDSSMIGWKSEKTHVWKLVGTRIFRIVGKEASAVIDGIEYFAASVDQVAYQIRSVSCVVRKQGIEARWCVPLYEGMFLCTS